MLDASDALCIAGTEVKPGQTVSVDLPITNLYHTPLTMPVQIVRGRRSGPVLFVCAAIHGDELNGIEAIRRVLCRQQLKTMRGCLIAVPIVNVQAFLIKSRYLTDRRDLNRSFPGSDRGSLAARTAQVFLREIVDRADVGIDLHTGALHRPNLPQIRADLGDPETARLATAFRAPLILNATVRPGSLREYATSREVPLLVYEAGEALRFDELSIRAGVRGVLNVMRAMGMLNPLRRHGVAPAPVVAESSVWLRAPASGILRSLTELGERVKPGQVLGVIADPYGQTEADVVAEEEGIVIGRLNTPPVNEGDALFHVARVRRPGHAAEVVELFRAATEPAPDDLGEPPVV